jgi:hypothetical protein
VNVFKAIHLKIPKTSKQKINKSRLPTKKQSWHWAQPYPCNAKHSWTEQYICIFEEKVFSKEFDTQSCCVGRIFHLLSLELRVGLPAGPSLDLHTCSFAASWVGLDGQAPLKSLLELSVEWGLGSAFMWWAQDRLDSCMRGTYSLDLAIQKRCIRMPLWLQI